MVPELARSVDNAKPFSGAAPVRQELIHVMRGPRPRVLVRMLLKPLDRSAGALDIGRRQAACQHLCPPAVQHRFKDAILGTQQPDIYIGQKGRNPPRFDAH